MLFIQQFVYHLGLAPEKARCLIPECHENPENARFSDFNTSIFWHDEEGTDFCRRYPLLYNHSISFHCSTSDFNFSVTNKQEMVECIPHIKGQDVVYDKFAMDSTAVTEFRLVCSDVYKVNILIILIKDMFILKV